MTKSNSVLLSDYLDYLYFSSRLSKKTLETYGREISFFLEYLEKEQLDIEITNTKILEDYLFAREDKDKISSRTESKALSALRSFFKYLVNKKIVDNNPASLLPKPKECKKLPKTISEGEVDEILDDFDTSPLGLRDRALFELIYSSGMRISEALAMNISQYNKEERSISIIGKRNKERIVFIGDKAIGAMNNYLELSRPILIKDQKEKALFLNKNGTRLTRQGAHFKFKEKSDSEDIEATIHTLRHSYATSMLKNGADIRSVQELLGHKDIKTTEIYTELDTSLLLSLFDKYSPLNDYVKNKKEEKS